MIMRRFRPSDGQKKTISPLLPLPLLRNSSQIGLSNMYKVLCKSLVL